NESLLRLCAADLWPRSSCHHLLGTLALLLLDERVNFVRSGLPSERLLGGQGDTSTERSSHAAKDPFMDCVFVHEPLPSLASSSQLLLHLMKSSARLLQR